MLDVQVLKSYTAVSLHYCVVVLDNYSIMSPWACRLLRMTQAVEVLPSLAINPTITMCPDSIHRDLLHVALTQSQVNNHVSYSLAGQGSHHFPDKQSIDNQ